MRTDVKAGLIVALSIVVILALYLANRSTKDQTDTLPFDVSVDGRTPDDAGELAAGPSRQPSPAPPEEPIARPPTPVVEPTLSAEGPAVRPATPAAGETAPDVSPTRSPIARPGSTPPPSLTPAGLVDMAPDEERADRGLPTTQPALAPLVSPTTRPAVAEPPRPGPGVALPPRPTASPPGAISPRIRDARRPRPTTVRYTIQKGDTLYDIAIDHYGAGRYWTRIRDANPGIDPNRLKVGQIILLPPEQDQATGPAGGATRGETGTRGTPPEGRGLTYVVGQGDTLTDIARNILGDGSRWREIYELNQDKLESPDVIPIGIELRLPPIENGDQP